ncbi:MAG: hypothetical protein IT219_09225 [Bacteroidales bacterium]|nr:hypothetical protein [Bacteroidales bacterium]
MKKLSSIVYLLAIILLVQLSGCHNGVQKLKTPSNGFVVGFYNIENLFDTVNDPSINDEEFLPQSKVSWNTARYDSKLENISRVIAAMDTTSFPHVLGLAEVENKQVLDDLIARKTLHSANYSIIHFADSDPRGIEVAALYRPDFFKPIVLKTFQPVTNGKAYRHILYLKGVNATDDTLHVFINHWTSRYGGLEETKPARMGTAVFLKNITDSLFVVNPTANIIIVGDLNDNPEDESLILGLNAEWPQNIQPKTLYNLSLEPHSKGVGTLYYKGWDFFDQVIVSSPLLGEGSLRVSPIEIVKKDWMLFHPKEGDARPNRTMSGGKYYGGFSDHLPVVVRLVSRNVN